MKNQEMFKKETNPIGYVYKGECYTYPQTKPTSSIPDPTKPFDDRCPKCNSCETTLIEYNKYVQQCDYRDFKYDGVNLKYDDYMSDGIEDYEDETILRIRCHDCGFYDDIEPLIINDKEVR